MRYRIKVEYQSENGVIVIYYSALGSSIENAIESLTSHTKFNEYKTRANLSIISVSARL